MILEHEGGRPVKCNLCEVNITKGDRRLRFISITGRGGMDFHIQCVIDYLVRHGHLTK
jgi:hypothetical protein